MLSGDSLVGPHALVLVLDLGVVTLIGSIVGNEFEPTEDFDSLQREVEFGAVHFTCSWDTPL
eukprot:976479-Amorphochlora_amoeboformis.AAC.2